MLRKISAEELRKILEERIDIMGVGIARFAKISGLSLEEVNGILCGRTNITPTIARKLYEATGIAIEIWIGLDRDMMNYKKNSRKTPS